MPKSGEEATPGPPRKRRKSTKKRRTKAPASSKPLSRPPEEVKCELAIITDPAEARVARALWKLQVNREDWEKSPEISPIVWRTFKNQTKAVDMLRFSRDEECAEFLRVYDALNKEEKELLPLEIPCLAAKVSPSHILGQIILMARDASQAESALIVMLENPNILRASAGFGTAIPTATRDREMILKASGTLATPAGPSINVNVFGNKGADEDIDEDDALEGSFLEGDVFNHDTKAIDNWGERRRLLMDEDKKR
jgi:hypothetical protein